MTFIPLKINSKQLCEIFTPEAVTQMDDAAKMEYSLRNQMFPTEVNNTSETYSRDAERTADYELEDLLIVNRKTKPEFTWQLIKAEYVQKLLSFLNYHYNFKNASGDIIPEDAPNIEIIYYDFVGTRIINTYLGQTISGTLVVYNDTLYWENFRIAFPER